MCTTIEHEASTVMTSDNSTNSMSQDSQRQPMMMNTGTNTHDSQRMADECRRDGESRTGDEQSGSLPTKNPTFSIPHISWLIPYPHNIVYISSTTYATHRFIQEYYFLNLKNRITVDFLLNQNTTSQTIPPPELDVTRFPLLF